MLIRRRGTVINLDNVTNFYKSIEGNKWCIIFEYTFLYDSNITAQDYFFFSDQETQDEAFEYILSKYNGDIKVVTLEKE